MRGLADLLSHPWLSVRVQIALGLFFVIAALPKIADPPSFAHMVYNYRLIPGSLVNAVALALPWFELLTGLALLLGLWRRTATIWIAALLIVFVVAISVNLARANAIDCGCFDPKDSGKSAPERLQDMRMVVLRDLGMLALCAQSIVAERRRAGGEAAGHPS